MPASNALIRFCLAHDGAFVIPAEVLQESGIDADFGARLRECGRLDAGQLANLADGFARYWQRCGDLHARAPTDWLPPRKTNLLVADDQGGISPLFEPFASTSGLLYVSDLDLGAEYVAYLLAHQDRLALTRSVRAAVIANLSYWFERDTAARQSFVDAAQRAQRPDAACLVAVGRALAWVDQLLHDPLRAPVSEPEEPFAGVDGTGLYLPTRLRGEMMALADAAEASLRWVLQSSEQRRASAGRGKTGERATDDLLDWLLETRPPLLIKDPRGRTVWSPAQHGGDTLRAALSDAAPDAVASVFADLRIVSDRSREFLARVRDPEALPTHCAVLETGGGAYVDPAQRAVVYELVQPGFDTRENPAPPYHRLLLGARVMHEWGHVAHTAKILRVPDERRAEYADARAALGECFAGVVHRFPERLRADALRETEGFAARPTALPQMLARKTLARVGDYLANLMSARLIPGEEMQAYVRTNVRHHMDEDLGLVSELARYAYEVHYLGLAGMPRSYFFETSRYRACFIEPGIVSEDDTHALFDAAGAVLACYCIDESRLDLGAR